MVQSFLHWLVRNHQRRLYNLNRIDFEELYHRLNYDLKEQDQLIKNNRVLSFFSYQDQRYKYHHYVRQEIWFTH